MSEPNTIKVLVDDEEVEVAEGTSVFHACEQAGKQPPHFCYHPALGVDGNCRMCMVKVEGMPKPQISCDLRVKDGMKIDTPSEEVERLRSGVLELILVNHPIDCPICDQSGECSLQDYYMETGLHQSYVPLESKVHKPKVQDIGGDIVLDAERCVACSRCVRFCDSITHTGELARRRMVADLTVSEVVTSWSRAVLPTALVVAAVATMLLVRPSLIGIDAEPSAPLALEEMLADDIADAWTPPAEPDPTTAITFAGSF